MSPPKAKSSQEFSAQPAFSSVEDVVSQLNTNVENGLGPWAVQNAQRDYGPNRLEGEGSVKWYSVLFKQICNAMILVSLIRTCLFHTWHPFFPPAPLSM